MRSPWTVLRWSLVLAPMVLTGAWLRADAARPRQVAPMVHLRTGRSLGPAPPATVDRTSTLARTQRPASFGPPQPPPQPPPTPTPDPCAPEADPLEAPAQEVFFGATDQKVVALTFDDGPSRENTPRVLRALERADVQATFFVLGDRAERMPELLAAIDDGGHEIGNHGYSHTSMRSLWKSQIRDEVCRTHRAVAAATGRVPTLVRPPFGRYAPSAVPLLGGLGYDLVLWSVDAHDWRHDDPARVARRVVQGATPGAIILMHDRESVTAQAVPLIVEGLRRRGYRIVPVSALLAPSTD